MLAGLRQIDYSHGIGRGALMISHISVWGSSFVGWHPARIRRSFRPPRPLLRRSLTLTHSLTHSSHHSLTH